MLIELMPFKNQTGNVAITLLLMVLAFVVGGVTVYLGLSQKKPTGTTATLLSKAPSESAQPIGDLCKSYGVTKIPEDFLPVYIAKTGDSAGTILTANGLDPTNRLSEFYELNSRLQMASDSAIPQGTKVVLPPKEVDTTSGILFGAMGQLKRIEDKTYWLKTRTENSEQGDYPVTINSRTKVLNNPQIGSCVKAVIQQGGDTQVYFITAL